ncbi:UbiA prenyltransferase family protein [Neptunitalea lumnitzerae]|uniref:Prenyltransferase n=1 Tax=Neptunitalea lumnitzerae TaxID=2965509 RepID=A0ABQ5MIC7_9FLAO|nr:hypothetical protein [Neptunitalea sp. Y10]GLB48800.1 hypothetical protein Y10_11680 [Neptunitalea sp. Y10]
MWLFRKILKFYIEASIHVAISVACLTALTFEKFQIPLDIDLCIVAFLATISSYNFMKYATNAQSYFRVHGVYLKFIQGVSILCTIIMIVLMFFLSLRVLMVLALSSVFTAIYALPLLPGNKSFRSLHGLKIYMVGFCWALITVIIPVVDDHESLSLDVWIEFVQRFLVVVVLIIPFDIRDLKDDSLSLGTLPQQIGVNNAKRVGYAAMLLFLGFTFFKTDVLVKEVVVMSVVTLLTVLALYFAKEKQPEFYCGFWVESIPIIWFVAYLLLPAF